MKIPKRRNMYCPFCKKYTEHKVIILKSSKKRGSLSSGQRRFKEKMKGYGGYPRPKPDKGVKYGAKTTKKLDIRYQCMECKKQHPAKKGKRLKKVEMV